MLAPDRANANGSLSNNGLRVACTTGSDWGHAGRHMRLLTHVQLPDEAGHVAMLKVKRQQILSKLDLVYNEETAAALECRKLLARSVVDR